MSERGNVLLRALSLGAGVQSTTLALMAAQGEISPMPDCERGQGDLFANECEGLCGV